MPTTLTCSRTGQAIALITQLASSGEGEIWHTDQPGYIAKIYYDPRPERIRKLELMIANPPLDPNAHIQHISFAWPTALLQNSHGKKVGFLMPQVNHGLELLEVYNPLRRKLTVPGFNSYYLHVTALNVASIVWALHCGGYVLGDLKPQNVLVSNCALPSMIDTDSFQVRNPKTGELFLCPVGSEGFTPVELLDQDLATTEQSAIQDRFRLGVLIYLLLFGDYPYKGQWTKLGDSPDPNELLRQGWWPYAPNSPIQAGPLTIPLTVVHPELQACFLRCFNDGHHHPELRPTAPEWIAALKVAIAELKQCRKVKNHYYSKTHGKCYWCERKHLLGVDVFPGVPTPQNAIAKTSQRLKSRAKVLTQQAAQSLNRSVDLSVNLSANLLTVHFPALNLPTFFVGKSSPATQLPQHWSMRATQPFPPPATSPLPPSPQPKTSQPKTSPQMVSPVPVASTSLDGHPPKSWTKWMAIAGSMGSLIVVLLWLSHQSNLGLESMGLTLVGGGLCLGLMGLCAVLMQVQPRTQP